MNFRKSTLKMLSSTWQHSREYGRGRDGFYEYLEAVYDVFAKLRKTKGRAKKAGSKVIRWKKLRRISKNSHPMYLIILGSSAKRNECKADGLKRFGMPGNGVRSVAS